MLCLQAKIMAAKDNKKRGEVPEPTRWSNEITGIILITVGLLLLLSLVKYSPADLPRWGLLEAFAGKSGAASENLIGPVGGIIGFLQILLFGAAGGLIPVGFIWFGIVKLAFDGHVWPRAVIGFSILLLAAAAWLHAANFFFVEWAMNCSLNGPGGVIDRDAKGEPTGVLREVAAREAAARASSRVQAGGSAAMARACCRQRMTGVSGPSIEPEAIRNRRL